MRTALATAPNRCRSHYRFAGNWHTRCTREAEPTHIRHVGPGIEGHAEVRWHEGQGYVPRNPSEAAHAFTVAPPRGCRA